MVKPMHGLLLEKLIILLPNVLVVNHKFIASLLWVFENEDEFAILISRSARKNKTMLRYINKTLALVG
jgi:hypothetical protein